MVLDLRAEFSFPLIQYDVGQVFLMYGFYYAPRSNLPTFFFKIMSRGWTTLDVFSVLWRSYTQICMY